MATYIATQGWSGLDYIPVDVVGETPKRFRVKLLKDCRLPGRYRNGKKGQLILVPKTALRRRE
jgi:hypothetical protein